MRNLLVTGVMRSGTTMVHDFICENLLGVTRRPEVTPLSDVLAITDKWRYSYEAERFNFWLKQSSVADAIEDACWDGLTSRSSSQSWFTGKDPELVRYPRSLLKLAERKDCSVILCIRDPLDVFASLLEVNQRRAEPWSPARNINLVWEAYQGLLRIYTSASTSKRIYCLKYESWIREHEREIRQLASWLDVEIPSESLSYETSASSSDPFYSSLFGWPPSEKSIGSFVHRLSQDVWSYLASTFSGVRQHLGYQPIHLDYELVALGAQSLGLGTD